MIASTTFAFFLVKGSYTPPPSPAHHLGTAQHRYRPDADGGMGVHGVHGGGTDDGPNVVWFW